MSSTLAEQLAEVLQAEIVARAGLHDCRTHAKTWDLLRLTRMPAVRVELGYLTSPVDRPLLVDAQFRDGVAEAIMAAIQRIYQPTDYHNVAAAAPGHQLTAGGELVPA